MVNYSKAVFSMKRIINSLASTALFFIFLQIISGKVIASGIPKVSESATPEVKMPMTLLFLAILLVSAKFGGVIERYGQPSVVGELLAGIILSVLGYLGIGIINDMRHSVSMEFFAELGAVILLFQIGLESNISQMRKVGIRALIVALIGVIAPFTLGAYLIGPMMFPNLSQITYLFIGASLVATSVGITAGVYQSLGIMRMKASQTVLGAAVIDDVLGLLVLAVVSAMATGGEITPWFVINLTLKAVAFLALALALGDILAKSLAKLFSMINTGTGMKVALALSFALLYSYLASLVGLAPIVGAFAAGLVLDQVHFKLFNLPDIAVDLKKLKGFNEEEKAKIDRLIEKHQHSHVEELIKNIGLVIVPIFFVFTGLMVDASSLLDPSIYLAGGVIVVFAIIGKLVAGLAGGGSKIQKLFIGTSMIPRGEVGLIFAATGKALGAIPDNIFSTIILVIIVTTLIPPTFISILGRKLKQEEKSSDPHHIQVSTV